MSDHSSDYLFIVFLLLQLMFAGFFAYLFYKSYQGVIFTSTLFYALFWVMLAWAIIGLVTLLVMFFIVFKGPRNIQSIQLNPCCFAGSDRGLYNVAQNYNI